MYKRQVLRDDPDLIAEVVRSGDRVLLSEQAQCSDLTSVLLSLIHISEPTRPY